LGANRQATQCFRLASHSHVSYRERQGIRPQHHLRQEAWDVLTNLFIENESIQESKFDEALNEADNFAMLNGETPKELHR
jgi:hypothetical protein